LNEPDVFEMDLRSTASRVRLTVAPGEPGSPVLYVLDSFFLFDVAVGVASLLRTAARLTGGPFPALTTVGIGYSTDDPQEIFALRARDFTPTNGRATTAIDLPPLPFGGAEPFLSALVAEIIPTVEARYPMDGTRRGLAGFSFSGLFGLYVLFHRPETFSCFLIGSPSLWWDDGLAFEWEQAWARTHDNLAARVFLSVGANEQLVGDSWRNEGFPLEALERLKQVDNVKEMAELLSGRAYPSLRLETAVFEGEYHLTAPAAAITRGVLTGFED
jgi:predicted alpha/beta superfamily hydrolase